MTAVVTGAGSGIGRATAELLLDAGEAVVGVDVDGERLSWLDGHERAAAVTGDVGAEETNAEMVSEAIWHFGSLDALVLNAGIAHIGPLEGTGPDLIDRILRVNLRSVALGLRAALPALSRASHPAVVSFEMIWSGHGQSIVQTDGSSFSFDSVISSVTVEWSAQKAGWRFLSDPAAASHSEFAAVGHEKNGVFFR